ncbi:hypothetical protein [Streptomyces sp. NPDC052701]|uniref:hypothetical protein n=1 Tax=Streptomyces sp. NPDC052701 TaxID=3155533 RepID=UPI00343DBCE2
MNDSVPQTQPGPEAVQPGPEAVQAGPGDEPAAPAPLGVPRTPTGDAGVDAALDRLGDVDHLATDGHAGVYEDVHRELRDALTALDARPGPAAPTRHPTTTLHPGPAGHPSNPPYQDRS